jgi:hypothetical protein
MKTYETVPLISPIPCPVRLVLSSYFVDLHFYRTPAGQEHEQKKVV